MFFNARWLDPALGRFSQADTLIPEASQGTQAWDRYAGMNNNPVRFNDPTGHMVDDGCNSESCDLTNQDIIENLRREADWLAENENIKCASGEGNHCGASAAEISLFLFGGMTVLSADIWVSASYSTLAEFFGGLCLDGDCSNEVRTGTNVVYRLIENGTTKYIGISNDFSRRAGEHLRGSGWSITPIQGLENLSRYDARAVEQVLIEHYGLDNLYNMINSIATSNSIYQEAIQRGTMILQSLGFFIRR